MSLQKRKHIPKNKPKSRGVLAQRKTKVSTTYQIPERKDSYFWDVEMEKLTDRKLQNGS